MDDISEEKTSTDWNAFDAKTDTEIERAVESDPSSAPILPRQWFERAEVIEPGKRPISIRLDREVLAYFMRAGRGYQSRINAVLLNYVRALNAKMISVDESSSTTIEVHAPKHEGRVRSSGTASTRRAASRKEHPLRGGEYTGKSVHTLRSSDGKWVNKIGGEVISKHRTQEAATDAGRKQAIASRSEHVIYGRSGKVRDKKDYGNDPLRARSKQ